MRNYENFINIIKENYSVENYQNFFDIYYKKSTKFVKEFISYPAKFNKDGSFIAMLFNNNNLKSELDKIIQEYWDFINLNYEKGNLNYENVKGFVCETILFVDETYSLLTKENRDKIVNTLKEIAINEISGS